MPDLYTSLQKYDLGHLRIVAELWGLELGANETEAAAKELCASLLDPDLLAEITESLPPEAQTALETLAAKNGRIPWAEFTRRFGDVREMGPGKRDREKPHQNPASTAEILFYRALLARAFFNTANGAQEFAYIPDDLYKLMSHRDTELQRKDEKESPSLGVSVAKNEPLGRPASPVEKAHPLNANDYLLDDATTLLAALRLGIEAPQIQIPIRVVEQLLKAAKIILKSGPKPEKVKSFLEAPREETLQMLADAWLESDTFNELRQLPGLVFEGEWQNQPAVTRKFLLNLLDAIPEGKWWSLPAFIRDVKARYPDFQRPAGDYDSWFIKRQADGEYLRGFAHWEQVDGALIKYFITGVLFWLGQVELASPEEGAEPTAFRVLDVEGLKSKVEDAKLHVSSQGKISVPRLTPRTARYQIARFCEWDGVKVDEYQYRVTPASLKRAIQQGLKVEHLLSLLAKYSAGGIPPVLVKALKRWEANGTEARVQTQVVLRVSRPEVLEELRKSKAARFLGEMLGPTTVVLKDGAQSKVLATLAELGLLAEEEK
ncbi:MAG: helicase-associated domain-containing protein [Anaerolineales bacterium]|nr:helicase-associated domain-containing protein [Anaerolineales bacterium]